MEPGRQLDALVAEKVMGYQGHPDPKPPHIIRRYGRDDRVPLPGFSTDVAAAWEIEVQIEKAGLQEEYIKALIEIHDLNVMLFDSALEYGGNGISIPLAIWTLVHSAPDEKCYAALKAVGIKEGKENEDEIDSTD